MPTDEPDILANQVDGVIIVVKFGKTPKEVIKRTLGSLSGVNILGIVFNGVEFPTKRHQYYYFYK
jgi:Mrp family chromosome partitioning ATPase